MNLPLIKAIIILPGTALVYLPALIVWLTSGTAWAARFPPDPAFFWLAGILVAVAGLTMMVWTMRLFATKGGGGTPAPWQPVENFIVLGPYRHVRNLDGRLRPHQHGLFCALGGTATGKPVRRGLCRIQAQRAALAAAFNALARQR
jgi:hypothetical protein